jgi:hypothetical protein
MYAPPSWSSNRPTFRLLASLIPLLRAPRSHPRSFFNPLFARPSCCPNDGAVSHHAGVAKFAPASRRATDRVRRARRRLTLFAREVVAATPNPLRRPYTNFQRLALTEEERFEHLRIGMYNTGYARCPSDVF